MSSFVEFDLVSSSTACCSSLRQWMGKQRGCIVVVASFFFNFVLNGLLFNYNLLFVAFQQEFGSSATLTGWVGSFALGIPLVIAPFTKVGSERFGYRSVAIFGVVTTSVGVFVTSFLPSLLPMFGTFGVMAGVGAGVFTVCAFDLIVLYFPERNTIRAVAFASTGSTIGMLAFSQIMDLLITKYGWRVTLRVMAALLFITGIPCVLTFILPSRRHSNKEKEKSDYKLAAKEEKSLGDLREDSMKIAEDSHDSTYDQSTEDHRQCSSEGDSRTNGTQKEPDDIRESLLIDVESRGEGTSEIEKAIDNGRISDRGCESSLVAANVESALPNDRRAHSKSTVNDNAPTVISSISFTSTADPQKNKISLDHSETKSEHAFMENTSGYTTTAISNGYDNSYKKLAMSEEADATMTKSQETQEDVKGPGMLWKIGRALSFPELWMISVAIILNGIGDCFYYVNVINYLMSNGFEEQTGVQFVFYTALTNLVCKVLLVLLGEYLPCPRIFLQVFSNGISICALVAFMLVSSVIPVLCISIAAGLTMSISNVVVFSLAPDFFGEEKALETSAVLFVSYGSGFLLGSLVGQSIDNTGSYTSALFAFIGIYITSGLLLVMAPFYQRIFARDRFVTFDLHRTRRKKKEEAIEERGRESSFGLEGKSGDFR